MDDPRTAADERLPDHLREVLLFETSYRLQAGTTKAEQILKRFGFSAFTYRRLLKEALDHPAADGFASHSMKNKWFPSPDGRTDASTDSPSAAED